MTAFQLKDHASITAAMLNQMRATQDVVTDFNVGSAVRTLLESAGIEIEEFYQRTLAGILDAIPTSIYKTFDFEVVSAAAARGTVHVTFGGPIVEAFTVPAGTVFVASAANLKFTSLEDVEVPLGVTSIDVVIVCATVGAVGNIGANAITGTEGFSFPGGTVLSNPAFTSGSDGQTEAERKARFAEFVKALARGTPASILYAAKQARITNANGDVIEYVARVGLAQIPGLVKVYIYGSAGEPTAELLASAQNIVSGYRDALGVAVPGYVAAGVEGRVLAMTERTIDVALNVTLMAGLSGNKAMKDQIATLLAAQFDSVASGDILEVAQLTNAALTLSGMLKVTADNNENVVCGASEVLKLGRLTVRGPDGVEWPNA
jgi:hypothetical protein